MRTFILASVLAFALPFLVNAQQPSEEKIKEIEAKRTEFVIQFMKLTPEEAEKFKPLYQQYLQELRAIHKKRREFRKQLRDKRQNMTEEEAKEAIEQWLTLEEEKQEIIRKYYTSVFPKAIPNSKLILLPVAERKFKKELLKDLKSKN